MNTKNTLALKEYGTPMISGAANPSNNCMMTQVLFGVTKTAEIISSVDEAYPCLFPVNSVILASLQFCCAVV